MSDEMGRALGADGATTVEIAGKQCTARPLGLGELTLVQRDCVERYKRGYLKTYADNADLLPKGHGERLLQEKMDEAAKWDVDDLPSKHAHDSDEVKLTKGLRRWLVAQFDLDGKTDDRRLRRLCAAALDAEMLSGEAYQKMTGERMARVKVPYVNWWITADFEGKITLVWVCFRHNGVTREQVTEEMSRNPAMLVELSREIENLSTPSMGNG